MAIIEFARLKNYLAQGKIYFDGLKIVFAPGKTFEVSKTSKAFTP